MQSKHLLACHGNFQLEVYYFFKRGVTLAVFQAAGTYLDSIDRLITWVRGICSPSLKNLAGIFIVKPCTFVGVKALYLFQNHTLFNSTDFKRPSFDPFLTIEPFTEFIAYNFQNSEKDGIF